MLISTQRSLTEDGPWASDEVTVTNRYGLRAGLRLAQPSGQFTVTNAWDAAGRWWVVGGTAGTFTYAYPAGSAGTLPLSLALPGGNYITNTYDARCREIAPGDILHRRRSAAATRGSRVEGRGGSDPARPLVRKHGCPPVPARPPNFAESAMLQGKEARNRVSNPVAR
jgi:hypothetical protein